MYNKEDLKKLIKSILDEILFEMSTTGGVAGYDTPFAFTGKDKEEKKKRLRKCLKYYGYELLDKDPVPDPDQLEEARKTNLLPLMNNVVKSSGMIKKRLGINYIQNGIVSLVSADDGNAYEITILPVQHASQKNMWKKIIKK